MIIDAHYHLDERMEPIPVLIEKMDRHGIEKTALIAAVVDPFKVDPVAEFLSGLIRKLLMGPLWPLGRLGYDSTVTGKGRFKILAKTYPIYPAPDNPAVAAAIKACPDRFYGWIFVNPSVHDPLAEIEKTDQGAA